MGLQPQYKNKITEYSGNTDKQLVYVLTFGLNMKHLKLRIEITFLEIQFRIQHIRLCIAAPEHLQRYLPWCAFLTSLHQTK